MNGLGALRRRRCEVVDFSKMTVDEALRIVRRQAPASVEAFRACGQIMLKAIVDNMPEDMWCEAGAAHLEQFINNFAKQLISQVKKKIEEKKAS